MSIVTRVEHLKAGLVLCKLLPFFFFPSVLYYAILQLLIPFRQYLIFCKLYSYRFAVYHDLHKVAFPTQTLMAYYQGISMSEQWAHGWDPPLMPRIMGTSALGTVYQPLRPFHNPVLHMTPIQELQHGSIHWLVAALCCRIAEGAPLCYSSHCGLPIQDINGSPTSIIKLMAQ